MADENIERIVKYVADTSQAISQLDKLTAATERNAAQMDNVAGQLESFGNKLDVAGAFYIAKDVITSVAGAIKGVIDQMDDLGNSAQNLGVNVEVLQGYQFALQASGVKAADASKALATLGDQITKINDPLSNSARLLREMGVTAEDTADTALAKIADAFANAENGTNKTAIAIELFGRALGTKMVAALNGGSQALNDATEELRKLGIITEEDTKKASEFNSNLAKMEALAAGVGRTIVSDLLPAMNEYLTRLYAAIKAGNLYEQSQKDYFGWVKGFWTGKSGATPFSFYAQQAEETKKAAESQKEWEEQTKANTKALEDWAGAAKGAAAGLPAAQLTAVEKWGQGIKAAGEEAKLAPQKIEYLRNAIKATSADTAEGRAEIAYYEKQLKSLEGTAAKAKKAKAPELSEWERWLKSMEKSSEAVENIDKKVAYLEDELKKLRDAGEEASPWAVKLQGVLDKLKPPDAVTLAIRKLVDEAKKLDEAPGIIKGLEANLVKLEAAGPSAANAVKLTTDEILKLKAAGTGADAVVAAVTVELNNLAKTRKFNQAASEELWSRFGTEGSNAADIVQALNGKQGELTNAIKETDKAAKDLDQTIKEGAASFVTDWVGNMIDGFGKTKASFEDMIEDMLKMIAKLIVQWQVANAVKAMGFGTKATGGAWNEQGVEYMAQGGILNGPTFFSNAGRLTVAGEAGPEAVVPLRRNSAGDLGVSAAPVTVNVTNNTDSKVTTATKDNEDGSRQIDIYIERKVKQMMNDGTMDRSMRSSYGVSRQPAMG